MDKVLICIPCYKESKRLAPFLEQILALDQALPYQLNIRFLDDGSGPEEQQKFAAYMESAQKQFKHFQIGSQLFATNRGKGAVLRDGFSYGLTENFNIVGFSDGDGATPFYEILAMIEELRAAPALQVLIGSRIKCLGKTVERSYKRHLSGRIFATLLSNIFNIPVYDSQCGAKLFKTTVLSSEVLKTCYDQRWLFDTQLLILLYKGGVAIRERMVDWADVPGSKVNLLKDSYRMFMGLLQFRTHLVKKGIQL